MKRILIYIASLALLTLAPVKEADIGSLHPAEVVLIYREGDEIIMKTDTGDWGKGTDGLSALKNLKDTTPGTIYLDTAEYLLIGEGAEETADELRSVLKRSVRVCGAEKEVDLKEAAVFLSVHGTLPQFKTWKTGDNLPKLTDVEERLKMS